LGIIQNNSMSLQSFRKLMLQELVFLHSLCQQIFPL